ncbi:hypothetical protein TIFTF001_051434 [Ficus carica]|uniref:Uncharacterized protein n=1 Tax=Ficus carica TaxID=3494 RepID=A0AA88CQ70_FICCA|nr:hypothetical protein TIFTF001_051434 [Ficus carica]
MSKVGLGADEAFLLSSRSALTPDLELAFLGFLLESLPFRDFRPLPLAWSRLPLAKAGPLPSYQKCPGRTTKEGLHILAYGACLLLAHQHVGPQPGRNPPFCLKLVLKIDLIALHASRSLRLLVRHQNLAEPSRYMTAVFTAASSDVVRQAAEKDGQGKSELNSEEGRRLTLQLDRFMLWRASAKARLGLALSARAPIKLRFAHDSGIIGEGSRSLVHLTQAKVHVARSIHASTHSRLVFST